MEYCIYVFSGTGTSLSIAKNVSNYLGNAEIKLIPYLLENTVNNEIIADTETIGLIFPNYFGGIPNIIKNFINILNLDKVNYIFSIVTAGGGQGYSLKFLEKMLLKKGKKLNYGKYITGISNYIVAWYYDFIIKTGEQRDKIIRKIEEQSEYFAKDISQRKAEVEKSKFLTYLINRILSSKKIIRDTRLWDKEFIVDDNCIGCETCKKVCQVKNIKIENKKPIFQHNCQRCMACIQYCPKNAIGFNGKPLNKPRYFHPDYPAENIIDFINNMS
jgi:ferredoxin